ncbi:hypothetical protein [Aeromonas veronii]|uniref:hypothetical protein n=1 Tax=Aeromonas veronii TaxID=654 RepID=UPI001302C06B|nr:hypothetical protein [Aeromonas veronii]KAE9622554.1 hypothetical protein GO627_20730 [Aeromonas veronii]
MSDYVILVMQGILLLGVVVWGCRRLEERKRADWSKKCWQWQVLLVVVSVLFMSWKYYAVTTQHKAEIEWKREVGEYGLMREKQ